MNTSVCTADVGGHMRRRYDGRPSRTYGQQDDFWPPALFHGVLVAYTNDATESLYLGQASDKLVRGVLGLVDAVHDGRLSTAIRVGNNQLAFGVTLQIASDVIYVSGEEGKADLTVRLQRVDDRTGRVKPIIEPYDGWMSKLPLAVALYRDGSYYLENGGSEASLVIQELDSVRREAHEMLDNVMAQPGLSLPYAHRVRRFGDGGVDTMADVRIESSGKPSINMYVRKDSGDNLQVLPIVVADWNAANRFRAAR